MIEPAQLGQLHFWIGCIAIVAGFTAFVASKGSAMHVAGGRTFVITMALLAMSGLWLSIAREILFTVYLSALTLHLIITGWASLVTQSKLARIITRFSALGSGLICVTAVWGAWVTAGSPGGELNGLAPEAFLLISGVALLIAGLDLTYAATTSPDARSRLGRHLWRMGFAFFLATGIFFFGNNHVLPEGMRTVEFLSAPVIAVVLWTAYFATKVRLFTKSETH